MKNTSIIAIIISLFLFSCEKNTELITEEIMSPSTELSNLVEFRVNVKHRHGGLIDNIEVRVIENKEVMNLVDLQTGANYFLQWDLKAGIKAYVEVIAYRCLTGDYADTDFAYLEYYQEIIEITADKNDKDINVYLENDIEIKDLTQIEPLKIHGRVLNENGEPVIAKVELSSEFDAVGTGTVVRKDNGYTDLKWLKTN